MLYQNYILFGSLFIPTVYPKSVLSRAVLEKVVGKSDVHSDRVQESSENNDDDPASSSVRPEFRTLSKREIKERDFAADDDEDEAFMPEELVSWRAGGGGGDAVVFDSDGTDEEMEEIPHELLFFNN